MGSDDACSLPGLTLGLGFSLDQSPASNKDKDRKLDKEIKNSNLLLKFDHGLPSLSLGSLPQGDETTTCCFQMTSSINPGSSSYSNSGMVKRKKGGGDDVEVDDKAVSSRGSDDDEEGSPRKKLRLTKEQSAILEDSFKQNSTLNPNQKKALARKLKLRPRQVEVWFQNRRARTKLKQTEMDCELLKKCCDNLTDENKRLHRELQELRALKLSEPDPGPGPGPAAVFMQIPAATLTMCPSCERVGGGGGGGGGGEPKAQFGIPFVRYTTC